jgi:SAM-dependent methyltransferase
VAQVAYELTPCPVCGAGESAELADADQMRGEVELLWEFHERRLKKGIPPERLSDRLAFSQRPPIRLAECGTCSHIYRNPWERKEALKAAYAGAPPEESVLEGIFAAQRKTSGRQVRRLGAVAGRAGRGLEVGSYAGGFLAAANDAGWNFEGLDVSEEVCAFVRTKGLRVTGGEIEQYEGAAAFDAIAIWNTFEQLYDARAGLQAARRLLRPQGILALRFPNGGFYRTWRARLPGTGRGLALRILAHNNLLSFPYRQGYTETSIALLLHQCGFTIVDIHGDTLARVADQWTTRFGAFEERWVKRTQRRWQRGWNAPWIEVYARQP